MKNLDENWDVIIIGGGITGAGIFREFSKLRLKVLLVEKNDFAWGTSSRSSKLVHGGLRYLKEGRIFLTRDSIKERERLLKEASGLVEPLGFLVPVYKGRGPGKWTLEAGLAFYDLIAKKRQHRYYNAEEFSAMEPHLDQKGLIGGFHFFDAQVDDARLVLRLIFDTLDSSDVALNYTSVETIHRDNKGKVVGITLMDMETHETRVLHSNLVINATGVWAEKLHPSPVENLHLRPLRGSHLIFPRSVLPINEAISFVHPSDGRAVFLIPWEGVVLAGTTDLDHQEDLSREPAITREEVDYLMKGVNALFPSLAISENDCISTLAGIRPVLSEGKLSPSEESREHVIWKDRGLVTITGGKLTTFRKLAVDTIRAAGEYIPHLNCNIREEPVFPVSPRIPEQDFGLSHETWKRLFGRYGSKAVDLVQSASLDELEPIPGTLTLWAELPYAAGHEKIRHLADLLLRRVRIGLLVPEGARGYLPRIKKICRHSLPWDRRKWKKEIEDYKELWKRAYSLPRVYDEEKMLGSLYKRLSMGLVKRFR